MDRIGQHLGNYRLTRLLGEGGFAEVYLGEHTLLGTAVAIKVLHTQVGQEDVTQFQQEARLLASLKHPHIIRVLDFGIEGRTPYLVMDYAHNGTLRSRHPRGTQLPVRTVVSYVKQVAEALQYAHDRKVVHRDIKPENMLLDEHGDILLSDFGIALIAQSSRYQSTKEMAGTMAYSAPEQIQGKPRAASDQYALGIVVYEWLSGDRPFHGSFPELVGQHLTVPPPSLREKVSLLSPDIDHVVLTALEKQPEERFTSISAFTTALEQASQDLLPTERPRPLGPSSLLYTPPPPTRTTTPPPLTATGPVGFSMTNTTQPDRFTSSPAPVLPRPPAFPRPGKMTNKPTVSSWSDISPQVHSCLPLFQDEPTLKQWLSLLGYWILLVLISVPHLYWIDAGLPQVLSTWEHS